MTNDARGTRRRKGQLPVVTDLSTPDWGFDRPSVRRGILMEWWFAWWAPLVFIPVSGLLALALLWLLQSIAPVSVQLQQQFAMLGGRGMAGSGRAHAHPLLPRTKRSRPPSLVTSLAVAGPAGRLGELAGRARRRASTSSTRMCSAVPARRAGHRTSQGRHDDRVPRAVLNAAAQGRRTESS